MGLNDRIEIVSVNVGRPALLLKWPSGDVMSAIDKRPVDTPTLALDTINLEGDDQADRRVIGTSAQPVHGGEHQAVYAYPAEHHPRLRDLTSLDDIWPGYMGENITTRGATEGDVCIGDTWRWGTALLQVSAPRGPCYKLGIRMGKQAARTAIRAEHLVGWYLRVLEAGTVPTSGEIVVESRHEAGVTVAEVQRALNDRANTYAHLAALEPLSPHMKRALMVRDRDLSGGVPEAD